MTVYINKKLKNVNSKKEAPYRASLFSEGFILQYSQS